MHMVMTTDETQIQMFVDWLMSQTRALSIMQNPECHVVVTMRRLRTDKKIESQKIHGQTIIKNEANIRFKKTHGPRKQ